MRILLLSVLVLSLSACQLLYRLPTRQGNVVDRRDVDKLQVGMTREQVKFVMGTPVASNPFRDDRWDYFAYYKSPRGGVTTTKVSVLFENDKLAKLEGLDTMLGKSHSDSDNQPLDAEAIINMVRDEKKDGASGGTRPQPNTQPRETPTPQGAP